MRNTIWIALFSVVMIACASATDAVMDVLSSRYDTSVFSQAGAERSWFDPRVSWKNKWKNGDRTQGEAFPLSSTALVPLTDAWHCFKSLTIAFIFLAVLAPFTQLFRLPWLGWVGIFFAMELLYGFVFENGYGWLFIRSR